MYDSENEPAVIDYIEYDGNDRPMNVHTDGRRCWDFNWSEREQELYYHESGGSFDKVTLPKFVETPDPPFKIFIRPGLRVVVPDEDRDATPEDFARLGLLRIDEPLGDPFKNACEGRTMYCTICEDDLPYEWTDSPCDHVWDAYGGWDGPGSDELMGIERESVPAFLAWIEKQEDRWTGSDFAEWSRGAWHGWCAALKARTGS